MKRILTEFGMGSSLRQRDYTRAAKRALRDALWHNSINVVAPFGLEREAMIIKAQIAVQDPDAVDTDELAKVFPYGAVTVSATKGGLDVPKPDGSGVTIIANAAISVFLNIKVAS